MKLEDNNRENYWNKIQNVKQKVQFLSSLFQNPIEITQENVKQWVDIKEEIVTDLELLETNLRLDAILMDE